MTPTPVVAFPGAVGGVVAAEAPDGTLFAVPTQRGGANDVAYVVDGVAAPAIAEHLDGPVIALAADDENLYVATTRDVTSYDRTSGAVAQTWPVMLPATGGDADLALAGGRLWAYAADGGLAELSPGSPEIKVPLTPGKGVEGITADATGVYLLESGFTTLAHVSAAGAVTTAPSGLSVAADRLPDGSAAVVAVDAGTLVVAQHSGEGLDASLVSYDAASLAKRTSAGTTVPGAEVVPTLAGPLVAGPSEDLCHTSDESFCVARTSFSPASTTTAFPLPTTAVEVALVGPYPAVFAVTPTDPAAPYLSGALRVTRLH